MFPQRPVNQGLIAAASCRVDLIPEPLKDIVINPNRDPSLAWGHFDKRVMEAMLKMKQIDIAGLKRAYDQH